MSNRNLEAWKSTKTYHSTVLEGEVVGKLVADMGGETVVASEGAVVRGSGSELDVGTELDKIMSGSA